MNDEPMSEEEVRRRLKLHEAPIDVESLIEDGILAKEGAWYRVLDGERLPEHVRVQIRQMKTGKGGGMLVRLPGRKG